MLAIKIHRPLPIFCFCCRESRWKAYASLGSARGTPQIKFLWIVSKNWKFFVWAQQTKADPHTISTITLISGMPREASNYLSGPKVVTVVRTVSGWDWKGQGRSLGSPLFPDLSHTHPPHLEPPLDQPYPPLRRRTLSLTSRPRNGKCPSCMDAHRRECNVPSEEDSVEFSSSPSC